MQIKTSYKEIFLLALPIMLGSAVQQAIALTDSAFLFHLSEIDFASIGLVSVFYLMISAIGFGFSRGGQIMIARRVGEKRDGEVGKTFYAMFYYELFLAFVLFIFMRFGAYYFFAMVTDSQVIFDKCMEYLDYRSYGVFFSFTSLAFVSLYVGISRPTFIMINAGIMAIINIVLNAGLIFGKMGMPAMGIGGAGLASTIAEGIAFVLFIIYFLFDKKLIKYNLFKISRIDWGLVKIQQRISAPVVAQAVVGFGSWFAFFGLIENLGPRALASTNLARMVYLTLSIPVWGFATSINTYVSNYIGMGKFSAVMPIIKKVAAMSFYFTLAISLPLVIFPEFFLYPLLGGDDMSLISETRPILYMVLFILLIFSIGGVYFNGLTGTGATHIGLAIQTFNAILYISLVYFVIKSTNLGLTWAWSTEILYWILMTIMVFLYLKSDKWHGVEV